jgi:unspecific monooxygenase
MTSTVTTYDPWSCAVNDDPFPYYAALRRESPVHHVESRGMWVISRYDDVQRALADTEAFSSSFVYVGKPIAVPSIEELESNWRDTDPEGVPSPAELDRVPIDPALVDPDEDTPLLASLAESDPPEHTRIRRLLTRPMSMNRIAGMQDLVRSLVDQRFADLARRVREHGAADVESVLANPLTLAVSGHLMNIPESDVAMLGQLAEDSLGLFSLVPESRRAEPSSYQPYAKYFRDRYTARLASTGDDGRTDLMHSLLRADAAGDSMSEEEFAANAAVVFRAGFETTTNLIVSGLRTLFAHPDQLDRLRAEPSLIPSAVEEMLRYEGPLHGLFRVTTRDVEIGGAVIPGGSFVQLLFASANRDGDHFADADTFDVTRNPRVHVAFGAFKHLCLGANLARLEARLVFEALLCRTRDLRAAGPSPVIRHVVIRSRAGLPITFQEV